MWGFLLGQKNAIPANTENTRKNKGFTSLGGLQHPKQQNGEFRKKRGFGPCTKSPPQERHYIVALLLTSILGNSEAPPPKKKHYKNRGFGEFCRRTNDGYLEAKPKGRNWPPIVKNLVPRNWKSHKGHVGQDSPS